MKKIIITTGAALITLAVLALSTWAVGNNEITYFLIALSISVYTVFVFFSGLYIGATYTNENMKTGAMIALKSQELNDTWDIKKSDNLTKVFQTGVKVAEGVKQSQPVLIEYPDDAEDWQPPMLSNTSNSKTRKLF